MNVEPWVVEILLGKVPAKTSAYKDYQKRKDIIELFTKIRAVNALYASKKDKSKAIDLFKRSKAMVIKLKETVEYCYENNRQTPIRITFIRNDQLRIEIIASETGKYVYVKVPVIEEDW